MALRSRCAEVFFEPLTSDQVITIAKNAAQKLNVRLEEGAAELISSYTVEGRKATSLLADAYGIALQRISGNGVRVSSAEPPEVVIRCEDVEEVARVSRLVPYAPVRASDRAVIGRILGSRERLSGVGIGS